MPKITELFAFVVEDEDGRGGEGVPATSLEIAGEQFFVPLMGADPRRIAELTSHAMTIARLTGKRIRLYRWTGPRQLVETIEPGKATSPDAQKR